MADSYERYFESIIAKRIEQNATNKRIKQEEQRQRDAAEAIKLARQEEQRKIEQEEYAQFLEVAKETRKRAKAAAAFLINNGVKTESTLTIPAYIEELGEEESPSSDRKLRVLPIWHIVCRSAKSELIERVGPVNDDSDSTSVPLSSPRDYYRYTAASGICLGVNGHVYEWSDEHTLFGRGTISIATVPPIVSLEDYHSVYNKSPLSYEHEIKSGINDLIARKLSTPEPL